MTVVVPPPVVGTGEVVPPTTLGACDGCTVVTTPFEPVTGEVVPPCTSVLTIDGDRVLSTPTPLEGSLTTAEGWVLPLLLLLLLLLRLLLLFKLLSPELAGAVGCKLVTTPLAPVVTEGVTGSVDCCGVT